MDWSLTSGPTVHNTAATELREKQGFMVRLPKAACFGRRMGVAIFNGGNVPFVMREISGGGGEYQLIGERYLDGLMDGQAVKVVRKSGISGATITQV